jgi:outer membrane receptor protein involved in Fe transport
MRDQGFETFDADTQFDWNVSARHHLTVLLSLYPQNLRFVNLNTFNPEEVTPNFRQRGYQLSFHESSIFGNSVLESRFSIKRSDVHVCPSTGQVVELNLFPEQNFGNWFNRQDWNSWRYQWSQVYRLANVQAHGQHSLSFGYFYSHENYEGSVANQSVLVLRENRTTSQRIDFTSPTRLTADANDFAFFIQDHWAPVPRFALDLGVRFDHDGLSEDILNVAPRLAFVLAPTRDNKTAIRGGIGLFYDKIPLDIATFLAYPAEVVTRFDTIGNQIGPTTFTHQVITLHGGLHVPYSVAWDF